jgi:hypothetical protein
VKARNLSDAYVTRNTDYADRERVRSFVVRSLLKGSFWTGAVDQILTMIREVITDANERSNAREFPLADIETRLARIKKPLTFSDDEVDHLLKTRYGRRNTTLVLSMLYPGVDLTEVYHQDHVFPRALLTETRLRRAGLVDEDAQEIVRTRDDLPNLQLLRGSLNLEKARTPPYDYIRMIRPVNKRQQYLANNDLEGVPSKLGEVAAFLDERREIMRERLAGILGK